MKQVHEEEDWLPADVRQKSVQNWIQHIQHSVHIYIISEKNYKMSKCTKCGYEGVTFIDQKSFDSSFKKFEIIHNIIVTSNSNSPNF